MRDFAQELSLCSGNISADFNSQLHQRRLPKRKNASDYCHAILNPLFSYAKEQAFYRYLRCITDLHI